MIHERACHIDTREQAGPWEGDSVCFTNSHYEGVNTWVERKTRFVRLRKHKNRKTKTIITDLHHLIKNSPRKLWQTVTLDQGSEFADYRKIHHQMYCQIYYYDPHSPWQRGTNENFTGYLRRYLPRQENIKEITQDYLDKLEKTLNNLPRKCLGFMTPKEVLRQVYPTYCRTSA